MFPCLGCNSCFWVKFWPSWISTSLMVVSEGTHRVYHILMVSIRRRLCKIWNLFSNVILSSWGCKWLKCRCPHSLRFFTHLKIVRWVRRTFVCVMFCWKIAGTLFISLMTSSFCSEFLRLLCAHRWNRIIGRLEASLKGWGFHASPVC